jgi:alpha-L-rhamnosidase
MKPPSIRKTLSLLNAVLWLSVSAALAEPAGFESYATGPLLRPVKVVSTSGNVQNADALVEGHSGYATLTMAAGGTAPMIILDYGRDVGGLPIFEVASVSGTPQLQAIYSESQQYLLPAGDGAPFFPNAPGDPSRVDTYRLSGPGLIVNHLVQGGERFEAVTLAAAGTVTLRLVGVRPTTFQPPLSANRGSFRSSDSQLDEIWGLGAYTLTLDQLPPGSQAPLWTVSPQGLNVPDSPPALYQGGGQWADYTAAFDVQVVVNEATWVVRDNGLMGYALVLDADNDALGMPNALRVLSTGLFGSGPVVSAPLPFDLKAGTWHAAKTVAAGSQVSVYLDGQLLTTFDTGQTLTGSFGFQNAQDAEGLFRNLSITASNGQTLYASSLKRPSVLADFAAGTNPLPVIIDGAKRDRLVWSGDIAVAGPTVYYSNGASEYVKGSLELFASFPNSNGEASSDLTPLLTPGLVPGDQLADVFGGHFSLSYSIYLVTNLYDYYLYTSDKAFIAQQWPAVERELGYLAANANAQHLLVTTADNGLDWSVAPRTGAVTEYNALYYRALTGAAAMAQALGKNDVAANLETLAGLVKDAVNATLFNAANGVYDLSSDAPGQYAQDANALTVLFGVAPPGQAALILQNMEAALATPHGPLAFSSNPNLISPYMSGFDVDAHFEVGDAAGALSLIRTVWGQHMTHDKPFYSGATFEGLAPDGTPAGAGLPSRLASLAHAWGSGPTSALSKYVLGVRPVEPGYKAWLVEPQPGDLGWAAGTVPTPYGPIAVSWQNTSRGLRLELWVPGGTRGTVGLPVSGTNASLSDNGRTVTGVSASQQPNGRAGYLYLQNLRPGAHLLQVTATGQ